VVKISRHSDITKRNKGRLVSTVWQGGEILNCKMDNSISENDSDGKIHGLSKTGKICVSVTVVAFFFLYLFVTLLQNRREKSAIAPAPLPEARRTNETQGDTITVV
jgi:predicted  nucleic acid-binding Zn ribbon protein